MKPPYLSAKEAAATLGIRLETLYAYVSRGLIRSEKGSGKSRRRRYYREDVEQLKARREERRQPGQALETALHFGGAVLESSITLIEDGHLYYRGHDVLELARTATLEEVAALVWQRAGADPALLFPARAPEPPAPGLACGEHLAHLDPIERLQVLLPILAHGDPAAWDTRPLAVARCGARVLRQMFLLAAGGDWQGALVPTLAAAWGCDTPAARRLLASALVLCVDHELNVSSFTARCVASAGSTPYSAVLAGLAALVGTRHGGHTRRVEALLEESGSPERLLEVMAGRLRRGETLPGLGQILYPEGDPRSRALVRLVEESFPGSEAVAWARAYSAAGEHLLGEHPTLDLGLVVTARALGLPAESGLTLFALGRTVGWIGHVLEQYESGQLIRPRAQYVGERPHG